MVLFTTKKHPRTKDLSVRPLSYFYQVFFCLSLFEFALYGLVKPCFLQPEDFWFSAPKKGVMVFALPGEPGLTELAGDFKIHFHASQGDFYWLGS